MEMDRDDGGRSGSNQHLSRNQDRLKKKKFPSPSTQETTFPVTHRMESGMIIPTSRGRALVSKITLAEIKFNLITIT